MKIKKLTKKLNKNLLILATATVLLVGGAFVYKKGFFTSNTSQTEKEYPVDTDNDGVYTNYKYGFKFEYPNDVFTYYIDLPTDNTPRVEMSDENGIEELFDKYKVTIYYGKTSELSKLYSEYSLLKLGDPKCDKAELCQGYFNDTKINNINRPGVEGFIIYREFVAWDVGTEGTYVHVAYIRKVDSDLVVRIAITSWPVDRLDPLKNSRLDILENIVSSFEFVDPAQL